MLTGFLDTGVAQIRNIHLSELRRDTPRARCTHFLRPLSHHGRL